MPLGSSAPALSEPGRWSYQQTPALDVNPPANVSKWRTSLRSGLSAARLVQLRRLPQGALPLRTRGARAERPQLAPTPAPTLEPGAVWSSRGGKPRSAWTARCAGDRPERTICGNPNRGFRRGLDETKSQVVPIDPGGSRLGRLLGEGVGDRGCQRRAQERRRSDFRSERRRIPGSKPDRG